MLVPMAALAVACGRSKSPALDDALKNDLALASQAQAYNPQQFVSPTKRAMRRTAAVRAAHAPDGGAPAVDRDASYVDRSSFERRLELVGRSGGYYPAPRRRRRSRSTLVVTPPSVRPPVRSSAPSTSRDKVKGGLIGAAAGGILGAVIGNNVDVQEEDWAGDRCAEYGVRRFGAAGGVRSLNVAAPPAPDQNAALRTPYVDVAVQNWR